MTKEKVIKIDPGINYITDWVNDDGSFTISQYLPIGKTVINKSVTGCGFTTWSLVNDENVILCSPRIMLLRNKLEQMNINDEVCFYFDRTKSLQALKQDLENYLRGRYQAKKPVKLLVTYDSFSTLCDMLEQSLNFDIRSLVNRIVVDECHCLIKDIKLKEDTLNSTLSDFLVRLFTYDTVLFISATPMQSYLEQIPLFKNSVQYLTLDWDGVRPADVKSDTCKGSKDAFDKIYKYYQTHSDHSGRNIFDHIEYGDGAVAYSYEAVIFLNSVRDICTILNYYINKHNLINPSDVTVICANTPANSQKLREVDRRLGIITTIPKQGEPHTTWTFVTRTAFEGVDFYSQSASTFVVANYNVSCLSYDIGTDIVQIVGRQRLQSNFFRKTVHIFYVNNKQSISDAEYNAYKQQKLKTSQDLIELWLSAPTSLKDLQLSNLQAYMNQSPNECYLTTSGGKPVVNPLLVLSDDYEHNIVKNYKSYIIRSTMATPTYPQEVEQIRQALQNQTTVANKIHLLYDAFTKYPQHKDALFEMLHKEGYQDIAVYFNQLPLERIKTLGYNSTKLDNELKSQNSLPNIVNEIKKVFLSGAVYSKAEAKEKLQKIYDDLGLNKTAKAIDLTKLIPCAGAKLHGIKAIRIL